MKKPNALFLSVLVLMAVLTLAMFVSRTSKTSSATTPASQRDVNTVTSHTEAPTSGSQSDVNTVTMYTDPINSTSIANPAFYTNAEVQKLATHEIGHCYSLDHANVNGSVMNGGAVPNWQDINLVNARY